MFQRHESHLMASPQEEQGKVMGNFPYLKLVARMRKCLTELAKSLFCVHIPLNNKFVNIKQYTLFHTSKT